MPVDATAVARVVGIDTHFKDLRGGAVQFLPQHIAILAQGASASAGYSLEPVRITSAADAAEDFGFGSPIHLIALELFPPTGGGVGSIPVTVFPLEDDYDAGLPSVGQITPVGVATVAVTYWVRIAGILSAPFTIAVGDTTAVIVGKLAAAVNAILQMPAIAANVASTHITLTSKWAGASANDIHLEVVDSNGRTPNGEVTFTVVQPTGGAADPDVATALENLGSTWITMIVNGLGPNNTPAFNALAAAGEGRWDQLVRRPFIAFTGQGIASVNTAVTIPSARKTDRVNCQLVSPGSVHLPLQIAAAQVREIAKVANNNPPTDYGSRRVTTLLPGLDGIQWDWAERDLAVKAGSSTIELKNGLVCVSDAVTMYHPDGEIPPAYRYVVDIVKLMNIIFNIDLEFNTPAWDGAPLIPDDQPTVNPNARKPSGAKAAVNRILDSLGLEAIISDPAGAKASTVANINSSNPKRLDLSTTVKLSGNANIISIDLNFGFFFGTPALVA
jgi:phage tail sheath gpL-like